MPADPLLTMKDVCRKVHRSRDTIREWCQAGKFPAPIVDGRRYLWRESWVDQWIDKLPRGNGAVS